MANKKFWKLTKAQSKLLFAVLGISAIAAPSGAIIYSLVSNPTYSNPNPWSNAIELDGKLENIFNEELSKDRTTFTVGENDNVGIYVSERDISSIRNLLISGSEWMPKLDVLEVKKMLNGTNASLSDDGNVLLDGNEMKELALFPTILAYPYDGENKYGEVSVSLSNREQGLFKYNIRFCLRLGIVGHDGVNHDLKKEYDFTLKYNESTTLSGMLKLINNNTAKSFVGMNGIGSFSSNEEVLTGLLNSYYSLDNENMTFNDSITSKVGNLNIPNNEYSSKRANSKVIHVKYNSSNIKSVDRLGASLFNRHVGDYDSMKTIFNKIGIEMPLFVNDSFGYWKYDRKSDFRDRLDSSDVGSYKGYLGYGSRSIENDDVVNSILGSEHIVFKNEVNINFLNTNRTPTKIYYDQIPNFRGLINYDSYDIKNDLGSVINGINYDSNISDINRRLNQQQLNIVDSIKKTIRNTINKFGVSEQILENAKVESDIVASGFDRPDYANDRNGTHVFYDKTISFSSVQTSATLNTFNKDGSKSGTEKISRNHNISGFTVRDNNPTPKNELNVVGVPKFNGKYFDVNSTQSEVTSYIEGELRLLISSWLSNSNTVLRNENEAGNLNYELIGPVKNGLLQPGTYHVKISAPTDVWNFKGSIETETFTVEKPNESEIEE